MDVQAHRKGRSDWIMSTIEIFAELIIALINEMMYLLQPEKLAVTSLCAYRRRVSD